MTRIILTCNYSPWSAYSGGGQHSTHNLAVALASRGHTVDVIYSKSPLEKPVLPANLPYTIHWASLYAFRSIRQTAMRRFTCFSIAGKVKEILQEAGGSTIVHVNGEEGACIGKLKSRFNFGFIATPRNADLAEIRYDPLTQRLSGALMDIRNGRTRLLGMTLHQADRCCPTSRFNRDQLMKRFSLQEDRFTVIPNGVTPLFFSVKRTSNPPGNAILYFGRLEKSKGIEILLKVFRNLSSAINNRLVIIGRGSSEAWIHTFIRENRLGNRIELHPWMPPTELIKHMNDCTLALFPSRTESFGNTICESMAAGVPVIASKTGAIPELIRHREEGFLVGQDDLSGFQTTVLNLLNSPELRDHLGKSAKARAENQFTWEKAARSYSGIYQEVLQDLSAAG